MEKINPNVDITTLDTQAKIALYRRARKLRLDTEKALAPIELLEKSLNEALIGEISKSGPGVVFLGEDGRKRVMSVTSDRKPTIGDWPTLLAELKKHDRFDLLQKRLAEGAVKEIEGWDQIPGVAAFNVNKLSDQLV